jgi:ligand-binding sensor domain-containing protein
MFIKRFERYSLLFRQMLCRVLPVYIILACLLPTGLYALKWQAYTNTNNLTDVVVTQNKIYAATWGGVVVYDLLTGSSNSVDPAILKQVYTSVDGLVSNDVRTVAFVESTGDLWVGTYNNGISIIRQTGMQTLNADSGLPSDKIRRITAYQSYIFVATDMGISQFYYLPGVYFPLLLHQYNEANTLGGLVSDDVRDITITPNGYLYCATEEGISFVHTDSLDIDAAWKRWTASNSPLPIGPVLSISSNQNYVAINTLATVHRHSADPYNADWMNWSTGTGGLADSVFTVSMTPEDGILIGYGYWDESIMTLSRETASAFGYIDSSGNLVSNEVYPPGFDPGWEYPSESVYRFIRSDSGTVFATWGEGFYLYNTEDHHIENNCIGFQTISEIVTDQNHRMWFGSGWLGGSMTKRGTRGVSEWSNGIWTNFTHKNSPLPSDNIRNVAVDNNNVKWFGSWDASNYGWLPGAIAYNDSINDWKWYTGTGIRQWNPDTGWSAPIPGSPRILNTTIAEIAVDKTGNILISSSGAGIAVFDSEYNYQGSFQMPASYGTYQSVSFIYDSGSRYFFGLNADNKLVIWNSDTLPLNTSGYWMLPAPTELTSNVVYGVVTINNIFGEEENWIASSQGLYMWDGTNWYRYDTDIKRRRYSGGSWVNDTLYYVDEERLFGSVREARPTAIFLDPFGRIWIGSLENGITMYDPETERFTNYFQGNSPLLSNYITCFGYDPIKGDLLIGTPDGLNTLEIGIQIKTETKLRSIKAFPNPFFPDTGVAVRIMNMPSQSMPAGKNVCRIYDSAGQLVVELEENNFARFDWNGMNKNNKKCSSGIYFFVVTDANGKTGRGKIALIRGERTN